MIWHTVSRNTSMDSCMVSIKVLPPREGQNRYLRASFPVAAVTDSASSLGHLTLSSGWICFPRALQCLAFECVQWDFVAMEISRASQHLARTSLSLHSALNSLITRFSTNAQHLDRCKVTLLPVKASLGQFLQLNWKGFGTIIVNFFIVFHSKVAPCLSPASVLFFLYSLITVHDFMLFPVPSK